MNYPGISFVAPSIKACGYLNHIAKYPLRLAAVLSMAVLLAGCELGEGVKLNIAEQTSRPDITISPVNVMSGYIEQIGSAKEAPAIGNNLFSNDGFENGLDGWTGCDGDSIQLTSDAYGGQAAAEIDAGNCMYRSVSVQPADELVLSCFIRVTDSNKWTGMGMGFSDQRWQTISEGPTAIINGTEYTRYDVHATAPIGTKYVSMWFYSETTALIDACSLSVAAVALPPLPVDPTNLLENSDFTQVTDSVPEGWLKYCGGSAQVISTLGQNELLVQEGACVSQALSAGDVAALQGNSFDLSCDVQFSPFDGAKQNSFAEIGITLDGVEQFAQIPANTSQSVILSGIAPSAIGNGFVSIYSEGDVDTLRVSACSLKVNDVVTTPVEPPTAIPLCTSYPSYGSGEYAEENGQVCEVDVNASCKPSIVDDPNIASVDFGIVELNNGQYCFLDNSVLNLDAAPACSGYPSFTDASVAFENSQFCAADPNKACEASIINDPNTVIEIDNLVFLEGDQYCVVDLDVPLCASTYPDINLIDVYGRENGQVCEIDINATCDASIVADPNILFGPIGEVLLADDQYCFVDYSVADPAALAPCSGYPNFFGGAVSLENGEFCAADVDKVCEDSIINDPNTDLQLGDLAILDGDSYCTVDLSVVDLPNCISTYPNRGFTNSFARENGQLCTVDLNARCDMSSIVDADITSIEFGLAELSNGQSCFIDESIDLNTVPVCNGYPTLISGLVALENGQICAVNGNKACEASIINNPSIEISGSGYAILENEQYCYPNASLAP